jgi:hypothetical protein
MLRPAKICFVVMVLVLLVLSCAKISDETTVVGGNIVSVKIPDDNAIPLEWGKLIAVSNEPDFESWVQLWFQDEEGTIRLVPYSIKHNRFSQNARVFKRK